MDMQEKKSNLDLCQLGKENKNTDYVKQEIVIQILLGVKIWYHVHA